MKKFVTVVGMCALLLILSGCGSSAKDQIIGKWEAAEGGGDMPKGATVEFTKDKMKMAMGPLTIEGTYKWVDNDNIEVSMKNPVTGKEEAEKSKVKVTKDELEITDKSGKAQKMKRAK